MLPSETIIALVVVYVVIVVLLLSLNLTSRWRWFIKATAIVVSGGFFVWAYFASISLLGWAAVETTPDRFQLLATRVVEPDKFTGAPGVVYIWVEGLNEENVPSGTPRAYKIAYTETLAERADEAQEILNSGEEVQGSLSETAEGELGDETSANSGETPGTGQGAEYDSSTLTLVFNDLPGVVLPGKGVL